MTSLQGTVRTGPVAEAPQATPEAAATTVMTTARLTFDLRRGPPRGSIFRDPLASAPSRPVIDLARVNGSVGCPARGRDFGARRGVGWILGTRGARVEAGRSVAGAAERGRRRDGGHELVVVGGFLADGRSSERVDAYSPATNRWRRLRDLPVAVNHAMAASDGRRLYVVGGYGAPTRAFVLRQGRWRRLPNLPEPRAAAGAAIVGRTLYVVGGVGNGSLAERALAFDLVRRSWSRIPGPTRSEHLGATALGGRVYAVAGRE